MEVTMKTILIVEDEAKMREFISLYLRKENYQILEAENGEEAIEVFNKHNVDLMVLDVMMPKLDGFQVCAKIREVSNAPIIILTAIEKEMEQVKGYELGADDYVTKPFKIKILLAKIKRQLTRQAERKHLERIEDDNNNWFIHENLEINIDGREVYINQQEVTLSPKEYELLEYLVINKGVALTRDQILENVWGYDFEGGIRVVDNHIKKLRAKLSKYSNC